MSECGSGGAEGGTGGSDGTAGVDLEGLSVRFGDVPALSDVSLSVADGEFFTLVGPSGCGKTTTLRAIAGFEEPTAGRVRIGGEDVTGLPPEDRNVGIVFQSYALFPHMTVRENVAYGLRFRDPPRGVSRRERVEELLELVDMAAMGDREPETLSGGQQQRVALVRALAPGPEVLLLDEPLSALDARLRQRLRLTVREVQRELDITTVYVTHDQAEALAISDRVAVMNAGRIEQVGPPEAVYREPASRFVAAFVGDNNLFDAEVASADPPVAAIEGAGRSGNGGEAGSGNGDARAEVRLPADADVTVGERVVLSVRPEAIHLRGADPVDGGQTIDPGGSADAGQTSDAGRTTLPATVETLEFQGDAYRVHCDWNGRPVLVKTGAREVPSGAVSLCFDDEDVRLV